MSSSGELGLLPDELVLDICELLDPVDVSGLSQTCRAYHALVYHSGDALWRALYLAQPLDDPRATVDALNRLTNADAIDWGGELRAYVRARAALRDPACVRADERAPVLATLVALASRAPPRAHGPSRTLKWLARALARRQFDAAGWADGPTCAATLHLHTLAGFAAPDYAPDVRPAARAFVYDFGNYAAATRWGPYGGPRGRRAAWEHVRAVQILIGWHLLEDDASDAERARMGILAGQPDAIVPVHPKDWVGINGPWEVSFAFCDHRELLTYNIFNFIDGAQPDPSLFADPHFVEPFRTIAFELRVESVVPDPEHPAFPKIFFSGRVDAVGTVTMSGTVQLLEDDVPRWHFATGQDGEHMWSSEGVQIGNVHGARGVLGTWTTAAHDEEDPVGPFWLRRSGTEE